MQVCIPLPAHRRQGLLLLPCIVTAQNLLRTLMCDPDPSLTAFSYTRTLSGIMSPSDGPWNSGAVSVPPAVTSLSHLSSVICEPDSVKAARSCTMKAIVNSVSICWPWTSEAFSGSIPHHCAESSNTSVLCTGCISGSEILHTEAACQLRVHLQANLCKCLIL